MHRFSSCSALARLKALTYPDLLPNRIQLAGERRMLGFVAMRLCLKSATWEESCCAHCLLSKTICYSSTAANWMVTVFSPLVRSRLDGHSFASKEEQS
eukprot:scaffold106_cov123-Cylindrotheca_fusiformis.AAC.6